MTYICVSNLPTIGSDNGWQPKQRQAIIWTNAGILLIGPLGTDFSEIVLKIYSRKCVWKCRLENDSNFVSALMCYEKMRKTM